LKTSRMKISNPGTLSAISAIIGAILFALLYLMYGIVFHAQFSWLFFLVVEVVLLTGLYLVNRYILENFIYDRIKLIYKTIHTLKLNKDEKRHLLQDLREGDAISKVGVQVMEWANTQNEEIEFLKKQENYPQEFLGNVSPELKTPIFNIQGYILTLLDGDINDPQINKDYLRKTEKNIERMIAIVEELETISRLETGEISLEITRFDLLVLIQEVIEFLEVKAQNRKIRLFVATDNSIPVYVSADKEKVRQVLINLIDNSIKYGKEGGRTKISVYDMDENILTEVSDDGIGIAEHHLGRLFERFYRVDKHRSRSQGGSGLGLAIVKHILEAHKQTVNVRSTPNVGSTLSFTLKKG